MSDPRLAQLRKALRALSAGQFDLTLPAGQDEVGAIAGEVRRVAEAVRGRIEQMQSLVRVTERINSGTTLADVLDHIYLSFRSLVPYDRMGFSLIEEGGSVVRAHWARSESVEIHLATGYTAPLEGSLRRVMESKQPRILNDLCGYLREHPESESTRLIVAEGLRASLTCPLVAMGEPVGFLFFSSTRPDAYQPEHVALLREVAGQVALIVEKSRLYEKLVALNEQKNTLLGMAAHDLRSPIAVVQGFVELVQDGLAGPTTARQQEVFTLVRQTCGTMLGIINNFLDVSAIEAGRLELDPKEVELEPFLREVAATTGMLAEAKQIRLELDIQPEIGRAVFDPARIAQVITNLISNAVKFSFAGTTVTLGGRALAEGIEIAVRDQGQGIPAEDLPRLFRSFGRGTVRPTAGEKSTGLGLAIVQRMVEAHGGTVRVESQPRVGTTVTVSLPRPPRR